MNTLTIIFIAAVVLNLLVKAWLSYRQVHHVSAHRNEVPETFAAQISAEQHQKAADYTVAKSRFSVIDDLYGSLLLLGWTIGGGLAIIDSLWLKTGWSSLATGTAVLLSMFVIGSVLELPVSFYRTFAIEQRFGFNTMTRKLFASDFVKQSILLLLLGTPLALAALWLMNNMGDLWWLYVWLLWSGFSLLMLWLYPTVIAPMFNKFRPLEDDAVRKHIENLLDRTGFASRGIFVMDGSRRSTHGNAYFTGFGNNKRIVFFDTLLEHLSASEIEAVLAHELGHFRHKHVLKRIILIFSMSLAGLALLGWLAQQTWFYRGLGVDQPSYHMALVLFMLAGPVFTFLLSPLFSWGSRKHEFEADRYAAQHANSDELVSALVKLYRENASTLTPDPVNSLFYDSHPPAAVRIAHLQAQQT
ncbi:MAG: M48 family metallopeptidase [Gammaproteobacteria bacterium]|nr:M48 family metallopeptidase [Gammaproteobacteria bacterium]